MTERKPQKSLIFVSGTAKELDSATDFDFKDSDSNSKCEDREEETELDVIWNTIIRSAKEKEEKFDFENMWNSSFEGAKKQIEKCIKIACAKGQCSMYSEDYTCFAPLLAQYLFDNTDVDELHVIRSIGKNTEWLFLSWCGCTSVCQKKRNMLKKWKIVKTFEA